MITEKVRSTFKFYNINIPDEVALEFKLQPGDELVFRKTIIDDGLNGGTTYGYTIEKNVETENA